MKICIVAEGCYPYVVGGVSGWINSMICSFPNIEFEILAIISNREGSGKFAYDLPSNVTAVYEAYLDDYDFKSDHPRFEKKKLSRSEYNALRSVVMGQNTEWNVLFDLFNKKKISVDSLLMGEDFLRIVEECYDEGFSQIVFSDFLWTMRSIYLPLFLMLGTKIPKADIYHCVATGYAGVLGGMAKHLYGCPLMVSEHGIYTREREEEILKATWVGGVYKSIWIDQFRKMSKLAYDSADIVTSLYAHAGKLQEQIGCPKNKIVITPNGITVENFENIPLKNEDEKRYIQIGAVLRVAPIKDVKTMIQAFSYAKEKVPALKLFIMGPVDEDPEYVHECYDLVRDLRVKDVVFTGRINTRDYLGRMDFTILTSISEGQPLTILESFAAHKPVIATDVGDCKGLVYGEEGDEFGDAGIITHIMNTQEISDAIVKLAESEKLRTEMGEAGYKRVCEYFRVEYMKDQYKDLYERLSVMKVERSRS